MSAKAFLDTNILIYAFSRDDARMPVALSLVEQGGIISVQTLNELINVSRKKLGRPWGEIERQLFIIQSLLGQPRSIAATDQQLAAGLSKRFGFGIFDSQMIASAIIANCDLLYTEDLQHGQVIEGLTIQNPFKS